jgi:hypothetical protein
MLDDLKETGGSWEIKEEALDRTVWITGFGRGRGKGYRYPVIDSKAQRVVEV